MLQSSVKEELTTRPPMRPPMLPVHATVWLGPCNTAGQTVWSIKTWPVTFIQIRLQLLHC